jgi:hypothetical protein
MAEAAAPRISGRGTDASAGIVVPVLFFGGWRSKPRSEAGADARLVVAQSVR